MDHPSIKYIYAVLSLTHNCYFLRNTSKYVLLKFVIDHHYKSKITNFWYCRIVRIDWWSCRVLMQLHCATAKSQTFICTQILDPLVWLIYLKTFCGNGCPFFYSGCEYFMIEFSGITTNTSLTSLPPISSLWMGNFNMSQKTEMDLISDNCNHITKLNPEFDYWNFNRHVFADIPSL